MMVMFPTMDDRPIVAAYGIRGHPKALYTSYLENGDSCLRNEVTESE